MNGYLKQQLFRLYSETVFIPATTKLSPPIVDTLSHLLFLLLGTLFFMMSNASSRLFTMSTGYYFISTLKDG